jgi:hypothetical protein
MLHRIMINPYPPRLFPQMSALPRDESAAQDAWPARMNATFGTRKPQRLNFQQSLSAVEKSRPVARGFGKVERSN